MNSVATNPGSDWVPLQQVLDVMKRFHRMVL